MPITVKVYAFRKVSPLQEAGSKDVFSYIEPGVDGIVLEVCSTKDSVPIVCPTGELSETSQASAELTQIAEAIRIENVLKSSQIELLFWVRDPQVLDTVAQAIENAGAVDRAYLVLEDLLHVRVIRSKSSKVKAILKLANPFPNVSLLAKEGVNALALPASVLRPRVVRECSSKGVAVVAWLVNDVSQAVRAVRYGVKLIVTSRSNLKKELLQYLGDLIT
ncbi:MAG: hypothetical protein QXZ22_05295 [Sulfolobales archaeon]